jgi:uncharacterized protein (DUF427 family)
MTETKETIMPDGNSAPGFARQPDRIMEYTPADQQVRVTFEGQTIADSLSAIALREEDYPVAYYIPQADARMDLMARTDHSTHCPFKGDASYWTIQTGAKTGGNNAENAVWSYETPFDEAKVIEGYLAFYGSKVDAIEVG